MIPRQLVEETEGLRSDGYRIELTEAEGWANAVFSGYPVGPAYSQRTTTLLLRFPLSYPNGRPDMFWTDPTLTLKGGGVPHKAEAEEILLSTKWRRFSWHASNWNPGRDNVRTYLEFVNRRLAAAK